VQLSGPTTGGENPIAVSHPDGTETRAAMTLAKGEAIAGWGPDSASFLVWDRNTVPADVERVDVATRRRTPLLTILPADPAALDGWRFR